MEPRLLTKFHAADLPAQPSSLKLEKARVGEVIRPRIVAGRNALKR